MAEIGSTIASPLGQAVPGILGFIMSQIMSSRRPKPPDLSETKERGLFRQQGYGEQQRYGIPSGRAGQTLGLPNRVPYRPSLADVGEAKLQDIGREFEALQQQREQQQQGLRGFQGAIRGIEEDYNNVLGQYPRVRAQGRELYGLARQDIAKARTATNQALTGTIDRIQAETESFKLEYRKNLAEMLAAKHDLLNSAKERTAESMVGYMTAMHQRVQDEVEAIEAEAAANPAISDAQALGRKIQARTAGFQEAGNNLLQFGASRMNALDEIRLQADTNIANFRLSFTQAFSGISQQALAETGKAFSDYAANHKALSDMTRLVASDQMQWENDQLANLNWITSAKSEAMLRGAETEAAMIDNMTIPMYVMGPLMESMFYMERGMESQQFAYDQTDWQNMVGVQTWGINSLQQGFGLGGQAYAAEQERALQKDQMQYDLWGAGIQAAGSVGGGALRGYLGRP